MTRDQGPSREDRPSSRANRPRSRRRTTIASRPWIASPRRISLPGLKHAGWAPLMGTPALIPDRDRTPPVEGAPRGADRRRSAVRHPRVDRRGGGRVRVPLGGVTEDLSGGRAPHEAGGRGGAVMALQARPVLLQHHQRPHEFGLGGRVPGQRPMRPGGPDRPVEGRCEGIGDAGGPPGAQPGPWDHGQSGVGPEGVGGAAGPGAPPGGRESPVRRSSSGGGWSSARSAWPGSRCRARSCGQRGAACPGTGGRECSCGWWSGCTAPGSADLEATRSRGPDARDRGDSEPTRGGGVMGEARRGGSNRAGMSRSGGVRTDPGRGQAKERGSYHACFGSTQSENGLSGRSASRIRDSASRRSRWKSAQIPQPIAGRNFPAGSISTARSVRSWYSSVRSSSTRASSCCPRRCRTSARSGQKRPHGAVQLGARGDPADQLL